jgi:hypothetical protein
MQAVTSEQHELLTQTSQEVADGSAEHEPTSPSAPPPASVVSFSGSAVVEFPHAVERKRRGNNENT